MDSISSKLNLMFIFEILCFILALFSFIKKIIYNLESLFLITCCNISWISQYEKFIELYIIIFVHLRLWKIPDWQVNFFNLTSHLPTPKDLKYHVSLNDWKTYSARNNFDRFCIFNLLYKHELFYDSDIESPSPRDEISLLFHLRYFDDE